MKLAKAAGKSALEHLILSVKSIPELHETIIAAPQDRFTGYFKKLALDHGCGIYTGDGENITRRIRNAVAGRGYELVVRLNAEMPFFIFNTQTVRKLLESHVESAADYSYFHGLPQGLSPDVISIDALNGVSDEVPYYRRMRSCPDKFHVNKLSTPWDMEHLSLYVSKQADIEIFNKTVSLYGGAENTGDTDLFFAKLHSALKSLLEDETRLEEMKYFNQKLNFLEMGLIYEHLHSMPLRAQIDAHSGCNLQCTTCCHQFPRLDKMEFEKKLGMKELATEIYTKGNDDIFRIKAEPMAMPLYEKIAKEIFPYLLNCGFGVIGEPLMNKEILDFLKIARRYKVSTEILTNGTLINESHAREFAGGLLDRILISFDGARKKTFEEIRRGAGFDNVLGNIQKLQNAKEKLKSKLPEVLLTATVSRKNIEELPALIKLAADYRVNGVNVHYMSCFDFMDVKETLFYHPGLARDKFQESRETADRYGVQLKLPNVLPGEEAGLKRKPCAALWTETYFYAHGSAKPCCFIEARGGMAKDRFRDIWNSPYQKGFRRSFKPQNRIRKVCLTCGLDERRNNKEINTFLKKKISSTAKPVETLSPS